MLKSLKSRSSLNRDDQIARELGDIKRLLAVLLLKSGTSHGEIATALHINPGHLSRLLPSRKFPRFAKNGVQHGRA